MHSCVCFFCLSGRYYHNRFAKSLHKTIAEHLNDTVDVSAAFLHCALKGQFSLAVNHLLVNTGCESPQDTSYVKCNPQITPGIANIPAITENFLAIGHSSGTDTLCGILYALELFLFSEM